ncbi:TESP1 protein, partial [Bombycilla garrulus]|nr:TESP1 protein [Bombycilla garrulus]
SPPLAWWPSDAEEILHSLGFAGPEPGGAARVPPRFFSAPSRASGIDLGLFLRAQLRRLHTEDPCERLASRFQQVRVLAATADAFCCLYSRVSRVPPQGSASPYRDIADSAPLYRDSAPGQRLRRAVSSLCLYTGGGDSGDIPRGTRVATRGPPS